MTVSKYHLFSLEQSLESWQSSRRDNVHRQSVPDSCCNDWKSPVSDNQCCRITVTLNISDKLQGFARAQIFDSILLSRDALRTVTTVIGLVY